MVKEKQAEDITTREAEWERKASQLPERQERFITTSSEPIERLYTPADIAGTDYLADVGFPGEYPFLRGVHYDLSLHDLLAALVAYNYPKSDVILEDKPHGIGVKEHKNPCFFCQSVQNHLKYGRIRPVLVESASFV